MYRVPGTPLPNGVAEVSNFALYKALRTEELGAYSSVVRVVLMHSGQGGALSRHQSRLLEDLREMWGISETRHAAEIASAAGDAVVNAVHDSGICGRRETYYDEATEVVAAPASGSLFTPTEDHDGGAVVVAAAAPAMPPPPPPIAGGKAAKSSGGVPKAAYASGGATGRSASPFQLSAPSVAREEPAATPLAQLKLEVAAARDAAYVAARAYSKAPVALRKESLSGLLQHEAALLALREKVVALSTSGPTTGASTIAVPKSEP